MHNLVMAYMAILKAIRGNSAHINAEGEYRYMVFCEMGHAEAYAEAHRLSLLQEDEAAEFNAQDRCQFCGNKVC